MQEERLNCLKCGQTLKETNDKESYVWTCPTCGFEQKVTFLSKEEIENLRRNI